MNNGEQVLDDRIIFHYMATGITPAMAQSAVGQGSAYAFTAHDKQGVYLDGSKTYKVTLPKPVPAKTFWSFVVYSTQHRSLLETDQRSAGVDSSNPDLKPNEDGSYTVYFGPKASGGERRQLGPNHARQGLVRPVATLRPARTVVRQNLEAR